MLIGQSQKQQMEITYSFKNKIGFIICLTYL